MRKAAYFGLNKGSLSPLPSPAQGRGQHTSFRSSALDTHFRRPGPGHFDEHSSSCSLLDHFRLTDVNLLVREMQEMAPTCYIQQAIPGGFLCSELRFRFIPTFPIAPARFHVFLTPAGPVLKFEISEPKDTYSSAHFRGS